MSANHPTFDDGVTAGRAAMLSEILLEMVNRSEQIRILAQAGLADSRGYQEQNLDVLTQEQLAEQIDFLIRQAETKGALDENIGMLHWLNTKGDTSV